MDSVQNLSLNKNTNIHKQNILVDDLAANSTGIQQYTILFIFLNLIEALSDPYLQDYSQVYVTLLRQLYVTLL